mgnify:CR=1 FL=1
MPTYNDGTPVRYPNGGTLSIGADTGSLQVVNNYVDGSLEHQAPGYEKIEYKQGGKLRNVVAGDERSGTLKFELYRTPNIEALLTVMRPALASGEQAFIVVRIEYPNYLNATTGRRYTFTKCYLPDDVMYRAANQGPEFDKISIELRNFENSPTLASY